MAQFLQEYVNSRGVAMTVDREVGILRGVKLIGLESRNGRRYRESALATAATLYEEAKVNVNHPKEGPQTPRDYQDRLGVIRNVELRSGEGLFGDLHFNPKHVLAEQLLWDAEHNPRNVGFSHNVLARLSREGERVVVEEITKVQSVDLVADPAATQGLFEQAAQSEDAARDEETTWDALTRESLQLHRPDLWEEIQSQEAVALLRQLEEAETQSTSLRKRQRIYELLCEHQLSVSQEQTPANKTNQRLISPRFVEMLMHVPKEEELEALIAERADLVHEASRKKHAHGWYSSPHAREQMLVAASSRGNALASAQDFAETLKSSRN